MDLADASAAKAPIELERTRAPAASPAPTLAAFVHPVFLRDCAGAGNQHLSSITAPTSCPPRRPSLDTAPDRRLSRADVLRWLDAGARCHRERQPRLSVSVLVMQHAELLGLRPEDTNLAPAWRKSASDVRGRYLTDDEVSPRIGA